MKKILTYTLAICLVIIGLSVLLLNRTQAPASRLGGPAPQARLASTNQALNPTSLQGAPTRITIPRLRIELPIEKGYYDPASKTWNVSKTAAQYATITPPLNTKGGNTFIYGHNLKDVFGRLPELKNGDIILLATEYNSRLAYRLTTARETNPYDDTLFYYTGPPIVTVQTCSGLFDQNRTLYTFALSGVVE